MRGLEKFNSGKIKRNERIGLICECNLVWQGFVYSLLSLHAKHQFIHFAGRMSSIHFYRKDKWESATSAAHKFSIQNVFTSSMSFTMCLHNLCVLFDVCMLLLLFFFEVSNLRERENTWKKWQLNTIAICHMGFVFFFVIKEQKIAKVNKEKTKIPICLSRLFRAQESAIDSFFVARIANTHKKTIKSERKHTF